MEAWPSPREWAYGQSFASVSLTLSPTSPSSLSRSISHSPTICTGQIHCPRVSSSSNNCRWGCLNGLAVCICGLWHARCGDARWWSQGSEARSTYPTTPNARLRWLHLVISTPHELLRCTLLPPNAFVGARRKTNVLEGRSEVAGRESDVRELGIGETRAHQKIM